MLKDRIEKNFRDFLKEKRESEISILRMLKADIFNKEKEKRYKKSQEKSDWDEKELEKQSSLTDDEVLEIVISRIKKSNESIFEFEKGKREDLVEKEKKEIEILKRYLPEQLLEEEIRKIVKEIIEKIEAKDIRDMGKVMAELMPRIKGRADGALISKIVKEFLVA